MNTTRRFRINLAGDRPRLGAVTSRLWLATVDAMSLPGGQARLPMIPLAPIARPTPYRQASKVRLFGVAGRWRTALSITAAVIALPVGAAIELLLVRCLPITLLRGLAGVLLVIVLFQLLRHALRASGIRRITYVSTILFTAGILTGSMVVSPSREGPIGQVIPWTVPVIGRSNGSGLCVGGVPCREGHFLMFLALGASLVAQYACESRRLHPWLRLGGLMVVLAVFAAIDETVQGLAGRDGSMADWMADFSGAVLGLAAGIGALLIHTVVKGKRK